MPGLQHEVVPLDEGHFEEVKQFLRDLFPTTVRGFHAGVAKHLIIRTDFGGKGLKSTAPGAQPLLGISSVIDIRTGSASRAEACQITLLVEEKCRNYTDDEEIRRKVSQIVNEAKLGLIINERKEVSFIPKTNYWLLLKPLQQKIQEHKDKDPNFKFEYFLMVCKIVRPINAEDAQPIYVNPEEEVFARYAEYKIEFRIANEELVGIGGYWKLEEDDNFNHYRKYLLFEASKLDEILDAVKQTF